MLEMSLFTLLVVKLINSTLYQLGVEAQELKVRHYYLEKATRIAQELNKPVLLVGTPKGRHACLDVLLDISPRGECPLEVEADVRDIPFEDGTFGSCVCSHVIEHVVRPWRGIAELQRVSDYVCVLYPSKASLFARLHPGHVSLRWCWENLGPTGVFEYGRYLNKLIKIRYS